MRSTVLTSSQPAIIDYQNIIFSKKEREKEKDYQNIIFDDSNVTLGNKNITYDHTIVTFDDSLILYLH